MKRKKPKFTGGGAAEAACDGAVETTTADCGFALFLFFDFLYLIFLVYNNSHLNTPTPPPLVTSYNTSPHSINNRLNFSNTIINDNFY